MVELSLRDLGAVFAAELAANYEDKRVRPVTGSIETFGQVLCSDTSCI